MADEKQGNRKRITWIILTGLVVGLAVVSLIRLRQEESEGYSGEMRSEVVLGVEKSLLTAPVWVAENNGYFQEEGLNVQIIGFDSGKASLDSMLINQNVDICTVAQTPMVFHSFSRNDFVIIAAMVYSDNDVKVLTRQDRGIVKPSDLRGKKVGITIGSTGQFFLDLFLTHNDVLYSEVETIDFDPSQLPQALADGRVDAIVTWEPHILNAEELLGEEARILPSGGIYREDFYFVANKGFTQNNPETLVRFLKAIERGEEFIQENEEEAIDILSDWLGLDKEAIASVWSDFNFQLILDQSIIMCLEDEARWAIRNNLEDEIEVPNYLNYVYSDALEEVKPEAVTIIR